MIPSSQDINLLLREIEQELLDIDLRPADMPGTSRSSFPAWVQLIMLPAFDKVLTQLGDLPDNYELTPLAQLQQQSPVEQTEHLLGLIDELDALLC